MCVGVLLMSASITIFSWYASECFEEVDLQTPSSELGSKFKVTVIVTAILFFAAYVCFKVYRRALRARASALVEAYTHTLNDPASGARDAWERSRLRRQASMRAEMQSDHPEDYVQYLLDEQQDAAAAAASEGAAVGDCANAKSDAFSSLE
jgi:hypothetical protein